MTEIPLRFTRPALAAVCVVALLTGCVRTTAGSAVMAGEPFTSSTESTDSSAPPQSTPGRAAPVPGIETTLPDHVPPNAFACFPPPSSVGVGTVAQVADPTAPRITVAVPDGWTSEPGQGDVALTLSGPDGMSGTVMITATLLDPAAAFADYAATLAHSKTDLQVDTEGAKFCGYSSQKLTGTFLGPSGPVGFADRITHIWTNTKKYLVAIHMEGPAHAPPGFTAAKTALMQDFAVVIP